MSSDEDARERGSGEPEGGEPGSAEREGGEPGSAEREGSRESESREVPMPSRDAPLNPEERGEVVYDLFRRGSELLEAGDFAAAAIPLEQARSLEPDKTSIREALGRAYFRSGRFEQAGSEFAAVVERAPVNDFAHFCLGRALYNTGRRDEARHHAVVAAGMRPDRADYRAFRDRLRRT